MNYEDLTPELMDRARACKTPGELLALAQENGYELSDEELERVSGSGGWGASDYREYCSSRFCSADECGSLYCNEVRCEDLDCSPYGYNERY